MLDMVALSALSAWHVIEVLKTCPKRAYAYLGTYLPKGRYSGLEITNYRSTTTKDHHHHRSHRGPTNKSILRWFPGAADSVQNHYTAPRTQSLSSLR